MPDKDEFNLGPEILGTRLTVYHLLDSFLNPEVTESEICRTYNLPEKQVAAARAFVLRNPETVLGKKGAAEIILTNDRIISAVPFFPLFSTAWIPVAEWRGSPAGNSNCFRAPARAHRHSPHSRPRRRELRYRPRSRFPAGSGAVTIAHIRLCFPCRHR